MRRPLWLIAFVSLSSTAIAFAAEPLPQSEPDDAFEIEPPILIPNRDAELPLTTEQQSAATPAPGPDIEKLENDLRRAERNAAGAEHLYKIGAIAKVEAENRLLRVVRLRAEVARAHLAAAKEALAQAQGDDKKKSGAELREAESNLAHAIETAHAAEAERDRNEIAEAEINLARQRKLLSLGSGRKSEVAKAEQKLAELKAPKNE